MAAEVNLSAEPRRCGGTVETAYLHEGMGIRRSAGRIGEDAFVPDKAVKKIVGGVFHAAMQHNSDDKVA
jgi:hypothetical protein